MKQEKRLVAKFELLPISKEKKESIYERFDRNLIIKAVDYYHVQKHEPKDLAGFIEEICKRRLEKRNSKQK